MNNYEIFESAFFEAFASDLWCRDARFKRARNLASTACRDGYEKQVKRTINFIYSLCKDDNENDIEKYFRDYIA